ncbi:MAG: sigma-70 family RNA polymerase sigma factor, partial [Sedimentisphaerales bacterium]|nr:sigma-70 family RNA polymerase sigma factor [Sedimentisphaerales bacterium]
MEVENKDNSLDDLIGRAMEGNLIARNELTAQVSPRLRSYIYRSVLDDNATDDILQETVIAVFNSITSLKKIDAFWCWLFRIASNQVMNYFRAQSKNKRHLSFQDILIEKAATGVDPEGRLMNAELGDSVRQAISQLPARQRQAVSLRCYEQLSFKEIGSILEITEPHARVQFHRALETLRLALGKQGFGKASLLLALAFFGKITAPAQAANKISVTTATV